MNVRSEPEEPIRVVVADDHPFYREGIADLLAASGVEVVAVVASGEAAIEAVERLLPDVVVMDLNMPVMSGAEATRRLAQVAPTTRVLVLTVSAQEADVTDAIVAGASGYVLKESPVEDVVAGIRAAVAGHSFMSPRIASLLLHRVQEAGQSGGGELAGAHLSARELEVLALLAGGRSNSEIADALVISPSTVRHHISNILLKLHVENRVQAAVHAIRERLI